MDLMFKRNKEKRLITRGIVAAVIAAFALIIPKGDVLAAQDLTAKLDKIDIETGTVSYLVSGPGDEYVNFLIFSPNEDSHQHSTPVPQSKSGSIYIGENLTSGGAGTYNIFIVYSKNSAAFDALAASANSTVSGWENALKDTAPGYGTDFAFDHKTVDVQSSLHGKLDAPTGVSAKLTKDKYVEVSFNPVTDAAGYYVWGESHKGDKQSNSRNSNAITDTTYTIGGYIAGDDFDYLIVTVVAVSKDYTQFLDSDKSDAVKIYADGRTEAISGSSSGTSNSGSSPGTTSESSSTDSSSASSSSSDSSSSGSSSSGSSTPPAPQAPAVSGSAGGQSIKSWNDLNSALTSNNNNSSPVEVTVNNGKIPDSVTKTLATSKNPLHVLTGNGVGITINGGAAAPKGDLNVKSTVTSTNNSKTIAFESNKILASPIAIHTTVPAGTKSVNLYIRLAGQKIKISPKPLEPTADGRLVFPVILLGTYELDY